MSGVLCVSAENDAQRASWFVLLPVLTYTPGVPRRSGAVGGAAYKAERGAGRLGGRAEEVALPGRHLLRLQGHQTTAALRVRGMLLFFAVSLKRKCAWSSLDRMI